MLHRFWAPGNGHSSTRVSERLQATNYTNPADKRRRQQARPRRQGVTEATGLLKPPCRPRTSRPRSGGSAAYTAAGGACVGQVSCDHNFDCTDNRSLLTACSAARVFCDVCCISAKDMEGAANWPRYAIIACSI